MQGERVMGESSDGGDAVEADENTEGAEVYRLRAR